jgi:hypothetical protein
MLLERRIMLLKVASGIVIGFGVIAVLAALPSTSGVMRFLADLIFWPVDGAQTVSADETRLLSAISGGLMVGWGLLLWLLAARLFPNDPDLGRRLILPSISAWFVVDSLGSIAAGAPFNALFNIAFLPMFFVPLLWSKDPAIV